VTIGTAAFSICLELSITALPSKVTELSQAVFEANRLTNFNFAGITHVGVGAFNKASRLLVLNNTGSLISIGANAFAETLWIRGKDLAHLNGILFAANAAALTGTVEIPAEVTAINNQVFRNINRTIQFPQITPPELRGSEVFHAGSTLVVPMLQIVAYRTEWASLATRIVYETALGDFTVWGHGSERYTIVRFNGTIGSDFTVDLRTTFLNRPIANIRARAFSGQSNLQRLILPTPEAIETNAVENCANLRAIEFMGTALPPAMSGNFFSTGSLTPPALKIYVEGARLADYTNSWRGLPVFSREIIRPDGLAITYGGGVATIVQYLGDAVHLILQSTYNGFPLDSIANHAFERNRTLRFVEIEQVRFIGDRAFGWQPNLRAIRFLNNLPANISININAFGNTNVSGNTNMLAAFLSDTHNAAFGTRRIPRDNIADGVVFNTVSGNLTILTYVGTAPTSLTISQINGQNVHTVDTDAFRGANLTHITIGANVARIRTHAFSDMPNLLTATFLASTPSITQFNPNMFTDSPKLTDIFVPNVSPYYNFFTGFAYRDLIKPIIP
jgi:hypothetical protein